MILYPLENLFKSIFIKVSKRESRTFRSLLPLFQVYIAAFLSLIDSTITGTSPSLSFTNIPIHQTRPSQNERDEKLLYFIVVVDCVKGSSRAYASNPASEGSRLFLKANRYCSFRSFSKMRATKGSVTIVGAGIQGQERKYS